MWDSIQKPFLCQGIFTALDFGNVPDDLILPDFGLAVGLRLDIIGHCLEGQPFVGLLAVLLIDFLFRNMEAWMLGQHPLQDLTFGTFRIAGFSKRRRTCDNRGLGKIERKQIFRIHKNTSF